MKAIRIRETGGPDVLLQEEINLPPATANQISLRIEIAGVNFIDVYHRRGQYPLALPSGIGIEGIGISQTGERYFWLSAIGSYAQEINIDENSLTRLPESELTASELLPLLCQGMTAHYLVDSAFSVQTGDVALVTAAAGGVGLLLIQLLKSRGALVIACTSSNDRAALAREHGADFVGTYDQMSELVARVTGGSGVNVVYDSVGKDFFDNCLEALAPGGMYVLYGGASGPVPPFDLMRLNSRSLAIRRPTLATYTATSAERIRRLNELLELRKRGALRYPNTKIFPLAEAPSAHKLIESRTYTGKIGIDPWKI